MKSERLTNNLKQNIWQLIYDDKFKGEEKEIQKTRFQFGDDCYHHVYSKQDIEYMESAPDHAFRKDNGIKVYLGGRNITFPMSKERPIFYDSSFRNKFSEGHDLTIRFLRDEEIEEQFKNKKSNTRRQVFCIMNSCTTTKKLLEVWPECIKYLSQAINQPITTNLPAINTTELNKMLGL